MNQERAILHFNKFKALKNQYIQDTFKGSIYKILKVKLIKKDEADYKVNLFVESDMDQKVSEIDSIYAHTNFKTVD